MAMFSGVVLAAIAYLIRFVATQRSPGSTHLPQPDDPLWLKIHVYLGYAVLLGAAAMAFVGASDCARGEELAARRRRARPPSLCAALPPPAPIFPATRPQAFTSLSCARARPWQ